MPHRLFTQLAACHVLIAAAVLLCVLRLPHVAAVLVMLAGAAGIGAGWSEWTRRGGERMGRGETGGWLDLVCARSLPDRSVALCIIEHAAVLAAGVALWRY